MLDVQVLPVSIYERPTSEARFPFIICRKYFINIPQTPQINKQSNLTAHAIPSCAPNWGHVTRRRSPRINNVTSTEMCAAEIVNNSTIRPNIVHSNSYTCMTDAFLCILHLYKAYRHVNLITFEHVVCSV